MNTILPKIKKMNKLEILELLKKEGSCFVTPAGKNAMFIEHIYVNDINIESLELSPKKQFKEIMPDVWYLGYKSPKAKNLCYWLYKNCLHLVDMKNNDDERCKLNIPDKYSKNILTFYQEDGAVSSSRAYILPFNIIEEDTSIIQDKICFYSKKLHEEREVVIVYPPNYDKNIKYPCLIISDGTPWRKTFHLETLLYKEMEQKSIKPQIICFIIQKDRNKELPLNKNFSAYVSEELVPYLYEKGLILQGAENHTFFGSSYGGLAGQYIQMFYGDKIGKIICQSSSLWFDSNQEILNFYKMKTFNGRIYFSYGNCEIPLIFEKCSLFKKILSKRKDCKFVVFSGGHEYFAWQEDLLNAIKYFEI